ncbi:MAG: hypothetical protein AB1938_00935 [Myxococcota bacterium]
MDEPPHGTVSRATKTTVEVAFNRSPPEWMSEGRLRVDLVANDVAWERAKGALTT